MTKKHFIALADTIRDYNSRYPGVFTSEHIGVLGTFCDRQNPRFDRSRWVRYIAGECGPNGGKVKGGN